MQSKNLGYMRIQKLHETILALYNRTSDEEYCVKNANVFAELLQLLDD